MKKLTFALLLAGAFGTATAQDGNNICVFNAIKNYGEGGGGAALEDGIKCSDEAIVNEKTANVSKTWFYRGNLFTVVATDKDLKGKHPEACLEASKAFTKLNAIADPKFKDWEDANRYLDAVVRELNNVGVGFYEQKNFAAAATYFYEIKNASKVMEAHKEKSPIDPIMAMKNAATAAENSGDKDKAVQILQELLAGGTTEAPIYYTIGKILKGQGKIDDAKKIVDDGLAKYPKDANLLIAKINFYLEGDKAGEALGYINQAIEADPKNDMLWFVKGLAYEKSGKEDSLIYCYNHALEMNPQNFKALYNLGALYFNRAGKMGDDLNKLGNTAADKVKYEDMKKQRKELFLQAKPYFEKAQKIDPSDATNNRTLKQIELYTAE